MDWESAPLKYITSHLHVPICVAIPYPYTPSMIAGEGTGHPFSRLPAVGIAKPIGIGCDFGARWRLSDDIQSAKP